MSWTAKHPKSLGLIVSFTIIRTLFCIYIYTYLYTSIHLQNTADRYNSLTRSNPLMFFRSVTPFPSTSLRVKGDHWRKKKHSERVVVVYTGIGPKNISCDLCHIPHHLLHSVFVCATNQFVYWTTIEKGFFSLSLILGLEIWVDSIVGCIELSKY